MPVSGELEAWPFGQTEGDRLSAMREEAGLTPANMLAIHVAEVLVRHELRYLGWVSPCDPRHEHGELTALGAAGFPINGCGSRRFPGQTRRMDNEAHGLRHR